MKRFPCLAPSVIPAIFFVFLIALPLSAQAAHAHKAKLLNIQSVTSPGGIKAWLVEDHTLPIISMDFEFQTAGTAYDPAAKQGLSQIAVSMLDEGAGTYDSEHFQKALDNNSISMEFGAERDEINGGLKTLTRHEDLAFQLLQLALSKPRFDQEPLDRMKAAALTRIRMAETEPDWIAARLTYDLAFQGHPYANNAGGTISGIKGVTADDLKDWTAHRLTQGNLIIGVAGDITPEELGKRLDQVFGTLPAQFDGTPVSEGEVKNGGTVALYKKDIPQTVLSVMQPGLSYEDKDYTAAQIMNFILGGSGFGSRLMSEIREKRGLTYGISTSLFDLKHLDAITVDAQFKNENATQVLSLMRQEWRKMRDTPVSTAELQAAKSYMTGSMPLALTSTDNIAGIITGLQSVGRPIDYLDKRAAELNAITIQDVQRVSKRVLQPDNLTIVLVGQPLNVQPTRVIDTLPAVN